MSQRRFVSRDLSELIHNDTHCSFGASRYPFTSLEQQTPGLFGVQRSQPQCCTCVANGVNLGRVMGLREQEARCSPDLFHDARGWALCIHLHAGSARKKHHALRRPSPPVLSVPMEKPQGVRRAERQQHPWVRARLLVNPIFTATPALWGVPVHTLHPMGRPPACAL